MACYRPTYMACYNFDAHKQILIFFGRNVTDEGLSVWVQSRLDPSPKDDDDDDVTDKVGNQKML